MSDASRVRVILADDEKPARECLRRMLERDSRIEIVACCASGAETLRAIEDAETSRRPIHILLLDVQMPEMNGFEVVARLARGPLVIFVTACGEYALKAFESQAIDYLLKPFSVQRFEAAMDRSIRFARAGAAETLSVTPARPARPALERIVVKSSQRLRVLPVDQIVWIEAEGVYVNLHTRDGAVHLHRELLGALDQSLDPRTFVRIHRSAIVNIDVIRELRHDENGNFIAILRGGAQVRVGRQFRARLHARLGRTP